MKALITISLAFVILLGMSSCKKNRFTRSSSGASVKHKHLWMFHGGGR